MQSYVSVNRRRGGVFDAPAAGALPSTTLARASCPSAATEPTARLLHAQRATVQYFAVSHAERTSATRACGAVRRLRRRHCRQTSFPRRLPRQHQLMAPGASSLVTCWRRWWRSDLSRRAAALTSTVTAEPIDRRNSGEENNGNTLVRHRAARRCFAGRAQRSKIRRQSASESTRCSPAARSPSGNFPICTRINRSVG